MATRIIIEPSPRVTATYSLAPTDIAVLRFDLATMQVSKSGDDLVFTHTNGGRIVLQDFLAETEAPKPRFIIGENAVAGEDLVTALGQDLLPTAGPAVTSGHGQYEMSLSDLMDGIKALGGLDVTEGGTTVVTEKLLYSGTSAVADKQPTVQSLATTLIEDDATHKVHGNVLMGAVLGDGQHRLVWENAELPARFGSISRNADGSFTYSLNNSLAAVQSLGLGQSLQESFSYSYVDVDGDTAKGTLVMTIKGTNDNPVAQAGFGHTLEDGPQLSSTLPASVDVDLHDTYSFVVQMSSAGQYGSLSVQADGSYVYTLNNNLGAVQSLSVGASLTDTFSYTVVDSHGATGTNVLTVTIYGANDSPSIVASAGAASEDGPTLVSVLPAPVDVDVLDSHSFVPQTGSTGLFGSLTVEAGGNYSYTVNNSLAAVQSLGLGASLTDVFSYTVVDNHGATATNMLTITINGSNDSPTVAASAGSVMEDGPAFISTLPAPTDVDAEDSATFIAQVGTEGQYGSLTVQVDGSYTYTLHSNLLAVQTLSVGLSLTDSFSYSVVDSHGATATNILTITVNGTNDSPSIVASTGTVSEDGPALRSVLPAPVDVDTADTHSFVPQTGSAGHYGSLTVQAAGTYTYTVHNSLAAVQSLGLGASLTDSFIYTVVDNNGATASNVLTVTINGSNDAPTIAASAGTIQEDGPVLSSILPSPADVDIADTHTFVTQIASAGHYGSLNVLPDGSYTYTLNNSLLAVQSLGLGVSLTDSFSYTVVDSHGATASNTLTVTINGTNDSPTIAASAGAVHEDGPALSNILPRPVDIDAQDSYSFVPQIERVGQYGSLSVETDGSYVYTLNNSLGPVQALGLGASLSDTFSYTVVDSHGAAASSTLTVTINGTNDAPTIAASAGTVREDGASLYSILPLPADVDLLDSHSFVAQENILGQFGSLTLRADGAYIYTLNNSLAAVQSLSVGDSLNDVFTYTVVDSHGATASNTLNVSVTGSNDSPIIAASTAAVTEDTLVTAGGLLPRPADMDLHDSVDFVPQVDVTGAFGTFSVDSGGAYSYILNNSLAAVQHLGVGASLTDTFVYSVVDNNGAIASNMLTITINGSNDSPTIAASTAAVLEDSGILHSILPVPADVDTGDTHSFMPQAGTAGQYGNLIVQADGTYTYAVNNSLLAVQSLGVGVSLTDTFVYTVVDSHGAAASNVLTVTVNGTNDGPSIVPSTGSINEDGPALTSILPAPVDIDTNDSYSFVPLISTLGQYGSLTVDTDGRYIYNLNNSLGAVQILGLGASLTETFTYTAVDDHGAAASNVLTITIHGTNDAPTLAASAGSVTEDGPSLYSTLATPVDVDALDTVSFVPQLDNEGRYGNLSVRADGSYTYGLHNGLVAVQSLALGETLTDSFTYTVVDSHGAEVSSILTVTIRGTNDSPTLVASMGAIHEDVVSIHNTLSAPVDVDTSDTHSFIPQAASLGQFGSLSVQADGSYTYTLNNSLAVVQRLGVGQHLTDTFSYTATDNHGATATNVLTITISGTNDKPTVAAAGNSVTEDTLLFASGVLPTPVDIDANDSVSFVPLTNVVGVYGALRVDSTGAYTYTLNNNLAVVQSIGVGERLTDVFTYTVVDSTGATGTNVLTINVNGTNDAPRAAVATATATEDIRINVNGTLPIPRDVDIHDILTFVPQVGSAGSYGSLRLNSNGTYTYNLNNSAPVVQALGVGERLTDVFTYSVRDNHGASSSSTLTVTIKGTNDAPRVAGASAVAVEDTNTVITGTLPTPTDVDVHDVLSFVPQTSLLGSYGSLHVAANGTYTYTLNNNLGLVQGLGQGESLVDTFTYKVVDGKGGSATNTLVVQVQGTNDAPSVGAVVNSVTEDANLIATGALPTITDVDNSADGIVSNTLSYVPQVLTVGQYGSLSLTSTGQYVYTLNNTNGAVQGLTTGEQLNDVFIYTAVDGSGGSASNSLTITIKGTNDSPMAVASVNTAIEDKATVIEGTIVPQDIDNSADNVVSDVLHCIPKSNERGLYGNLTLDADGHYVYVLNNSLAVVQGLGAGDTLAEVFFYTVLDSHGGVNTNTLTVTVQGTNDAPLTSAFSNSVFEDYHNIVNGRLFASDPDNTLDDNGTDVLRFGTKLDEAGRYGTLTLASDGSYIYTLNNSLGAVQGLTLGEKLHDQFQYTVTDNHGGVSTNTLIISVNGNNDEPVAYAAHDSVQEDVRLIATGMVPAPTDPDNTLDGIVSDVVRAIPMTNVQGTYGSLSLDSTGRYVYTLDNSNKFVQALDKNDVVEDKFPYLVADAHGGVVGSTISISILGTKDKKGDSDDSDNSNAHVRLEVTEDTDLQDSSHIGSAAGSMGLHLITAGVLTGQYGTLTLHANGTITYSLNNSLGAVQGLGEDETLRDTFIVNVSTGGGNNIMPRIVSVQINGTNDAPLATTRTENLLEDVRTYVSNSVRPVHDVDSSADGIISDLVTVTPQTVLGQYGLFTITSNGGYTYILNNADPAVQMLGAGEIVTEQFSYTVQDGNGGVSTSILNFIVQGSNDVPTVAESFASLAGGPRVSLAGHLPTPVDVDAHDGVLFVPQVVQGNYGQWVLNASGEYAYTLHATVTEQLGAGESAVESFSYTVRDSQGGMGTNILHVTIYGRNDAPTVISASTSVTEDVDLTVSGTLPLPVDVDIHDSPFFIQQNATDGQYGTLYISSTGVYTYQLHSSMPAVQAISLGESLIDSLPYTVSDGKGGTATAYLNVSVYGSNDLPTVAATVAAVAEDIQPAFSGFLATPTDIDVHDVLSFVPLQNVMGMYGSLNVAVDGSFTYNLNSESSLVQGLNQDEKVTDIFTFTVMDGQGGRVENTLMVHITGQNDAPIAGTLVVAGPVEDGQMLATGILPMPIDPDTNDTVSFVARETVQGQYGVLTVQANGQYVYTLQNSLAAVQALSEGQIGVDEFTIMATDGQGASTAAGLHIQIMGSNDGPIITGSSGANITEDNLFLTGLLPAPMDVDSVDTVHFVTQHTTAGQFGALSVQSDGQYQYTLNTNLHVVQSLGVGDSLADTFDYSVDDGHGGKAFSTLTITINGTNDAPHVMGNVEASVGAVMGADVGGTIDDAALVLTGILPSPQDVDQHDVAHYIPQHEQYGLYGSWNIQSDGSYSYTIDPSKVAMQGLQAHETLTENVTYTVQDTHGATASGTLSITIDGAGMQELLHPAAANGYNLLNGDGTDGLDFSVLAGSSESGGSLTAPLSIPAYGSDLSGMLTSVTEATLDTMLGSPVQDSTAVSAGNPYPAGSAAQGVESAPVPDVTSPDAINVPTTSQTGLGSAAVGTIHVESSESMQDSIQQELIKQSGG